MDTDDPLLAYLVAVQQVTKDLEAAYGKAIDRIIQERENVALREVVCTHADEALAERERKVEAREKSLDDIRQQLSLARVGKTAAEEREAVLADKLKAVRVELNMQVESNRKLKAVLTESLRERKADEAGEAEIAPAPPQQTTGG